MKIKKTFIKIKDDYELRSYITGILSFLINIAFLVFNLVLGIYYKLPFNMSICFYYLLLILLRYMIINFERRNRYEEHINDKRIKNTKLVSWLLLLADLTIVVPIILMVLSQRSVTMGTIPAISVAAYTTYKITLAILNYKKVLNGKNLSLIGLKMINLLDALVSILTLQNTLVMVFGDGSSMLILTACTSAGMLIVMIMATILFIKRIKKISKNLVK